MSTRLPPFPLDDSMLGQIEHCLDHGRADNDEPTLSRLLDFLSGYDPSKSVRVGEGDPMGLGVESAAIYEYPGPLYHRDDLIRALIAEVRRLRVGDETPGTGEHA